MSGRILYSGATFQSVVGACIAGLILTKRPLVNLDEELPGTPQKLHFEAPAGGVDDIIVVTEVGEVYIQAKNTIRWPSKSDKGLAAVAAQFVRQFRKGLLDNSRPWDLISTDDRLVLAVGTGTESRIAEDLKEVLDRNRTGAATGLPVKLQKALAVFTDLLAQEWYHAAGSAITAIEQKALLAVCSVLVVGHPQRRLITEILVNVVAAGSESTLLDLLEKWADRSAKQGTGGDAAAIRLKLRGKVNLTEPPDFRHDITRLTDYSNATLADLARFTTIEVREGYLNLTRPIVDQVVVAARNGSLAITGEPGAGKSAILHATAEILGQQYPVFCFKVEDGFSTLDALRQEVGLTHTLVEVLGQVPGTRPAYLLLDALDASRGNQAEATYKKLLHQVAALPGWYVIASVRTFDLHMGREWQRLFNGSPPFRQQADLSFSNVRHLHVGPLDINERASLARQSPSLHAALTAGGLKLEELALNPFNLALLADLLLKGTSPEALTGVATRGQLLARYWQERIGDGTKMTTGLTKLVDQMLHAKAVTIPHGWVKAAAVIDKLRGKGVLLLEQSRQVIRFRHHILFDYAVAHLVLRPDLARARTLLSKDKAAGLLIAPSLSYWVAELKHGRGRTPTEFWELTTTLIADKGNDPIVRVEVARLAVETIQPEEDLTALVRILNQQGTLASQSLYGLTTALIIKSEAHQSFKVEPWARLVASLEPSDEQLDVLQRLIRVLLDNKPDAEALTFLGRAARRLLERVLAVEWLTHWLSRQAIDYVARTYGTDPVASRQLLARLLEPERFARFGYFEIPALAQHLSTLAAYDGELTLELVYRSFGRHDFSFDENTTLAPSNIMSLHSSVGQAFGMAAMHIEGHFSALLNTQPRLGIQVLATAFRGARERKSPSLPNPPLATLTVDGGTYHFEEDDSDDWAWDLATNHSEDYAEMYQRFRRWIPGVQDQALLADIIGMLLKSSRIALVWRTLFDAGVQQPKLLGGKLWQAVSSPVVLQSLSTVKSAITLLRLLYPEVPVAAREIAERAWLAWGFADFPEPHLMRSLVLDEVLQALGADLLASEEARAYLQDKVGREQTLINKNSAVTQSDAAGPTEPGTITAELAAAEATVSLVALGRAVLHAQAAVRAQATGNTLNRLFEAIQAFDAASCLQDKLSAPFPENEASAIIAEALGVLLTYQPAVATALMRLLELTYHPSPSANDDTIAEGSGPIEFGVRCARVAAAKAVADLAAIPEMWPLVEDRFESLLLHDPHPVVRASLVGGLTALSWHATAVAWQLMEKFASRESTPQVIRASATVLQRLAPEEAARLEPTFLKLLVKADDTNGGAAVFTKLLVNFAFDQGLPASQMQLRQWVENYSIHEKPLLSVVSALREYFALGYGSDDPAKSTARQRMQKFVWMLVEAIEPTIKAYPDGTRQPTEKEKIAYLVFNELAGQLFFAIGRREPEELLAIEAKRRCLAEYALLIAKFSTLGLPVTVHRMLSVLREFVVVDAPLCFDLFSEAILRPPGTARYEHERQGASLFVELVGEYLADYRYLFTEEPRQSRLMECLSVFSDAGWPEASRLFQQLPGLFL